MSRENLKLFQSHVSYFLACPAGFPWDFRLCTGVRSQGVHWDLWIHSRPWIAQYCRIDTAEIYWITTSELNHVKILSSSIGNLLSRIELNNWTEVLDSEKSRIDWGSYLIHLQSRRLSRTPFQPHLATVNTIANLRWGRKALWRQFIKIPSIGTIILDQYFICITF